MTYKIHITKKAENDLEGAADYIEFNLLICTTFEIALPLLEH